MSRIYYANYYTPTDGSYNKTENNVDGTYDVNLSNI